ncbi:hypothetical protein [Arthrobacter sp. SPG23]|uniref:hypothetical protein n=1 Tax=Arthrobacter sp. SPG23 TaxID=1610703 RepID=UPI000A3DCBDE|nr:hypothetical protein [Arthrobacter sp. SPG23]
MGIGDSIEKAARNAVEDLAGTAPRTDDGHVPDPGDPNEDIRVHSSISESSNATDSVDPGETPPGMPPERPRTRPDDAPPLDDPHGAPAPGESPDRGENPDGGEDPGLRSGAAGHGTPGPAGLPDPDPGDLRADPSEADGDPSTSMGRG